MSVLVGMPLKPFTMAKGRLAGYLDPPRRRRLGQAIALRTVRVARTIEADVRIVTGDPRVADWSEAHGIAILAEEPGGGLDGAARRVAAATTGDWVVIHGDLPLLDVTDLTAVLRSSGEVIAPARDGGTNLIKGQGPFPFSYGPGSFQRHLARRPRARVVTTPGLALDLDTPHDLRVARRLPAGAWLRELLGSIPNDPSRTRTP